MKKSSVKKIKDSTQSECYTIAAPSEVGWFSWREKPVSETYLLTLCEQLLTWAQNDSDAYDIDEFFESKKIWDVTANKWAHKHEFVREAINQANRIIGTRRHKSAFKRITDGGIMLKTQHLYKKEWHESVNKYHSDIKKDEEGSKKQDITIVYSPVPEHDLIKKSDNK